MSKFDSFWMSLFAELCESLEGAVQGDVITMDVSGIRSRGDRESWRGSVKVQNEAIVAGGGSGAPVHTKSLGLLMVKERVLTKYPDLVFHFSVDRAGGSLRVRSETVVKKPKRTTLHVTAHAQSKQERAGARREGDRMRQLAQLIKQRNDANTGIARVIGRPAHPGHIAEFVAADVFGIRLHDSASHEASDGCFAGGVLTGKTVNVKYKSKNDYLLNMKPESTPDYYLVLTGPRTAPSSSRGTNAPWVVVSVHFFDAVDLIENIKREPKTATSVPRSLWDEAEIYPRSENAVLVLDEGQRKALALFAT